jgi:phosphotransferase system enzyme I (PtsI)
MYPMISGMEELRQATELVEECKEDLAHRGIPFNDAMEIGAMIETPSAVMIAESLARRLKFFSIGTNDLIQYTLAVDRTDDTVSHLYDPLHPAVLHLLAHVLKTGAKAKVPVALCGEMAGDVTMTRLLLGLGLRQHSMHSAHLLDVKQQVLQSNLSAIRPLAQKMLRTEDPEKLHALLERLNA